MLKMRMGQMSFYMTANGKTASSTVREKCITLTAVHMKVNGFTILLTVKVSTYFLTIVFIEDNG